MSTIIYSLCLMTCLATASCGCYEQPKQKPAAADKFSQEELRAKDYFARRNASFVDDMIRYIKKETDIARLGVLLQYGPPELDVIAKVGSVGRLPSVQVIQITDKSEMLVKLYKPTSMNKVLIGESPFILTGRETDDIVDDQVLYYPDGVQVLGTEDYTAAVPSKDTIAGAKKRVFVMATIKLAKYEAQYGSLISDHQRLELRELRETAVAEHETRYKRRFADWEVKNKQLNDQISEHEKIMRYAQESNFQKYKQARSAAGIVKDQLKAHEACKPVTSVAPIAYWIDELLDSVSKSGAGKK